MMGGVRVDEYGRALTFDKKNNKMLSIPGLYAAGQAMGGLFGSNRLGSTSLTEVAVFGHRAGEHAANYVKKINKKYMILILKISMKNFIKILTIQVNLKHIN